MKDKSLLLGILSLTLLVSACKKEEDVQYPPTPASTAPQPSGTASVAPAPSASAAPSSTAPVPLDALTQTALDANIKARAKKEAPGMKEAGELFGGTIPEGGHVEMPLTLEPGKCYEVIAASQGGVVELDVEIQGKLLPTQPVGAPISVDNTSGPEAVIKPCYKNVLPMPMITSVWLKATRGAGSVAGRVYVK